MSLQEIIKQASAQGQTLRITGGNSKQFLLPNINGQVISTQEHAGIIDYQPEELFIKARSGTPLTQIEAELNKHGQMFPFEPPHFDSGSTLGGAIASGLSGSGRPWRGAARDFVLGCTLINGQGEQLHFGGEVIKNVAGYDVSRLMTGSWGTLGLLMDISVKTVPLPAAEVTMTFEINKADALDKLSGIRGTPLPITGGAWLDGVLYIRLSGSSSGVSAARQLIGGELSPDNSFWRQLKDQQLDFFQNKKDLWRLSLPLSSKVIDLPGDELIDWGGAQRWIYTNEDPDTIRQTASANGGHAVCYADKAESPFRALPPALRQLHLKLKSAFDPAGIFNPGIL